MTDRCAECDCSLELVPRDDVVRHRESTGFGPHNEVIRRFCSPQCRARFLDRDLVLEQTRQLTLAVWTEGLEPEASRAVVYGQ